MSFIEFPKSTYEAWRAEAEAQLKGAPFEKKLVTQTYEGIALQPIYNEGDIADLPHLDTLPGFAPYLRSNQPTSKTWHIAQALPYSTPEAFNEALRHDLERGQTAINLRLDRATLLGQDPDEAQVGEVGRGGVSIATVDDIAIALKGVAVQTTPLYVQASSAAMPTLALLVAYLKREGVSVDQLQGGITMDPLGALVSSGQYPRSLEGGYEVMARLLKWGNQNAPNFSMITVDGQPYSDGGAHAVQELAYVIATGVAYLRAMTARGLSVDEVAPQMRFALTVGSNFFMEIAKLRAARLLWAKVVKALGGDKESQQISLHVRTAAWNKSVPDPYVNMLRATTEAFSAAVGGCDSLHVSPFDEPIRQPDTLARRIARNTQLILQQESRLPHVIDPAGGSWYVETLTDQLARQAWAQFQAIEKEGGMTAALQAGTPQAQVAEVAQTRRQHITTRRDVFVGSNKYANLTEKPLSGGQPDYAALHAKRSRQVAEYRTALDGTEATQVLANLTKMIEANSDDVLDTAIEAALSGATLGELARTLRTGDETPTTITPIKPQRATEPFEELRAVSASYEAKTGQRPHVFLATMGSVAQHKPRADFATDFFQVGGFAVITPETGFDSPEAASQAALDSGASIVVICSTDDTYPDLVPPLTTALKAARPQISVIVAGYPKDYIEAFRQAGVDDFIHLKADVYAVLSELQAKL